MAFFLAIMTIVTFTQVVLRYAFGSGFTWSLEATTYSFAWLVLIGMSYGVRTQSHIAMDLVSRALPKRFSKVFSLSALTFCSVYALLMAYGSSVFVWRLYSLGHMAHDLPVTRWLLATLMPLSFVLLLLRFVQLGWQTLRGSSVVLGSRAPETSIKEGESE